MNKLVIGFEKLVDYSYRLDVLDYISKYSFKINRNEKLMWKYQTRWNHGEYLFHLNTDRRVDHRLLVENTTNIVINSLLNCYIENGVPFAIRNQPAISSIHTGSTRHEGAFISYKIRRNFLPDELYE